MNETRKRSFQVGDRVAIYTTHGRKTGTVTDILKTRFKFSELPVAMLTVKYDEGIECRQHPKQCRHLVKKKRRSVWILESNLAKFAQGAMEGHDALSFKLNAPCVEFREVREARRVK